MSTLQHVRRALQNGDEQSLGPITCYVANFTSTYPVPRRYTYLGCAFQKGNRFICGKSIEGYTETCRHNPSADGNHCNLFRFEVVLFDSKHGGGPVRMGIFNAATKLLGMEADDFQNMTPERQFVMLQTVTSGMPLVNVWVKTSADKRAVITRLEKVIVIEEALAGDEDVFQPAEDVFHTPRSRLKAFSSGSTPSGSSRSGTKSKSIARSVDERDADVAEIHRRLEETMEMLSALKHRDEASL